MTMKSDTGHTGHITPLMVYLAVGGALFILTAITVAVAQVHLGAWNAIVALGIASFKALLVALFFMHLLYDRKIYLVIVSISLVMLGLLISLTMADILRRGDIYENQAGPIKPEARIYQKLNAGSGHDSGSGTGHDSSAPSETTATQGTAVPDSTAPDSSSENPQGNSEH
jgi:cytochrome c oxidase subunit IV